MNYKIGYGYDSHRFLNAEELSQLKKNGKQILDTECLSNKPLILGGLILEDKYQKNFPPFKARSDGDVLYHAVVNALLSALSLKYARDIGTLFPNTDPQNSDRDSSDFLRKAASLIEESSYRLSGLKITLKGKLRVDFPQVEKNLHAFFSFQTEADIHIQGTSGEEMDGAGQGLGVEVYVLCFLEKSS